MDPAPNSVLITIDSLRWDVFEAAHAPYLKSLGVWNPAWAQGTYTLPAHMSAFMGRFPQTLDGREYFDPAPLRFEGGDARRAAYLWRLSPKYSNQDARRVVAGRNIVEGFAELGCATIGTGAVGWFNPTTPSGSYLSDPFQRFAFFQGPRRAARKSAPRQAEWLLEQIRATDGQPRFLFWNIGETHERYEFQGCAWEGGPSPHGDRDLCLERQRACLEFIDPIIKTVLDALGPSELVIFADHGEAMGEDGLWGHGFCHPAVMRVPLLIRPHGTGSVR